MEEKKTKTEFLRTLKFIGFSISAGVIQLGLSALFELFTKNWWVVYLIPLVASVVWNFTFNRKFTFKSANNVPLAMTLVAIYYAIFTPASAWWGDKLTELGWANLLVVAFNMIINFITEFLWQRFVVFRKSIDSAGEEASENKRYKKLGHINYEVIAEELKMLEDEKKSHISENSKIKNSKTSIKKKKLGEINYDSIEEEIEELKKNKST